MGRILVVDDEDLLRESVARVVKHLGHTPILAMNGEEAIKAYRQERPHMTITDCELPDLSGIDVFKRIHNMDPEHPVVMLTGAGTEDLERELRQEGLKEFLIKGASFAALKETIERLMKPSGESSSNPAVTT